MGVGERNPVAVDRRHRLDAAFLHVAVQQHDVDGFGLFRRAWSSAVVGRHQRAGDDAALGGASAGAAGERLQQSGGAAGGGGGKLVVRDVDGPGALADGNARQRGLILRIQPALRGGGLRRGRTSSASQGRQRRAPAAPFCQPGEIIWSWSPLERSLWSMRVFSSSKQKTRRTTASRLFGTGGSRAFASLRRIAPTTTCAEPTDVGGEYALYMMPKDPPNAAGNRTFARPPKP